MEIEILTWLYEPLLIEAAQTDFAIEEIVESAFRNILKELKALTENKKKGIAVKIDTQLHVEVLQYRENGK